MTKGCEILVIGLTGNRGYCGLVKYQLFLSKYVFPQLVNRNIKFVTDGDPEIFQDIFKNETNVEVVYLKSTGFNVIDKIRRFIITNFLIITCKSEVVHFVNPIPVLFKSRARYVFTIHDLADYENHRYGLLGSIVRRVIIRNSFRLADHILTISKFSESRIRSILGSSKPIYLTRYGSEHTAVNVDLKARGINSSKPTWIAYTGTDLNKRDALLSLVIEKTSNHIEFFVFGRGEYTSKIRKPNVRLMNQVSQLDMDNHIFKAVGVLYLSDYEGFGLPILEGLQNGLMVVTLKNTALVEHDKGGVIFVDDDPIYISKIITSFSNDASKYQDRISASLTASEAYTWDEFINQTLSLYT
jgi:glycosyltransferase involved in cell wall biosynthesis